MIVNFERYLRRGLKANTIVLLSFILVLKPSLSGGIQCANKGLIVVCIKQIRISKTFDIFMRREPDACISQTGSYIQLRASAQVSRVQKYLSFTWSTKARFSRAGAG